MSELQAIFAKLGRIIKVGGYIVIEAANFKSTFVTTFAWDLCRAVSVVLRFEGEIAICWEDADSGEESSEYEYYKSYCLVFSNLAPD